MAPELVRTFVVVKPSEHDAETGMANPAKASVVSCMAQGVVRIRNEIRNRSNEYTVDGTSAATASPNENYEQLAKPLVEHVVAGGDATMIFYGAADSGKTHTAFGSYLAKSQAAQTSHGLIHRAASEVFAAVAKRPARGGGASTGISLSVVDVYIAAARDVGKFVLAPPPESAMPSTTRKVAARGRISPATVASLPPVAVDEVEGGAYDAQVYRHPVASASELSESVIKVLKRRAALAGGVGQSKRAHTIVSVYVPSPAGASSENTESILTFVVCAGSERLEFVSDPVMLRERGSINAGLHALQQVCYMLSRGRPEHQVPYRASMLTKMLYQGMRPTTSRIFAVGHVQQERDAYDESLLTLQYVAKCKYSPKSHDDGDMPPQPEEGEGMPPMPDNVNIQSADGLSTVHVHDKEAMIQRLEVEVSTLRYNLELTHGHYQKLLEKVGGREYMKHLHIKEKPKLPGDDETLSPSADAKSTTGMSEPRMSKTKSMGGSGSNTERMLQMRRMENDLNEALTERDNLRERVNEAERDLIDSRTTTEKLQKHVEAIEAKLNDKNRADRQRKDKEIAKIELERSREKQTAIQVQQELTDALVLSRREGGEVRRELLSLTSVLPRKVENSFTEKEVVTEATRQAEEMVRLECRSQMRAVAEEKLTAVKNVKDQAEYFLGEERKHRVASARELRDYRASAESTLSMLREENSSLWEYAVKITRVIEQLESGHYAIKEKSGLKSYVIPTRDMPKLSNVERRNKLRMLVNGAMKLDVVARTDGAREKARSEAETAAMAEAELRGEISRLRQQLAVASDAQKQQVLDREKLALADEIENELASDQTVEYIRQLEHESREKSRQLVLERRKNMDLRIALDASKRQQGFHRPSTSQGVRPSSTGVRPGTSTGMRPGTSPGLERPRVVSAFGARRG
ncbi:kinesin-like protein [Pseudoscourfieldia marina]